MSDAAEIVIDTIGGRTFRASRRTWAHLEWTVDQLPSGCELRVIQGCFNTGVKASAGTHDYDAVLDVQIVGMGWSQAQDWLRAHGWAAWWRYPPTFSDHIHMVSLGYEGQVGVYVPGQVRDYYASQSGLAGHAVDSTWHPADIDSTVFDYDAWTKELHMDETTLRKILREEIAAELDRPVDVSKAGAKKQRSLRQMVKEVWQRS